MSDFVAQADEMFFFMINQLETEGTVCASAVTPSTVHLSFITNCSCNMWPTLTDLCLYGCTPSHSLNKHNRAQGLSPCFYDYVGNLI